MDKYALNLHDLKIGNIKMEANKIRDLQKTIEHCKEEIEYYKQQIKQNQLMNINKNDNIRKNLI